MHINKYYSMLVCVCIYKTSYVIRHARNQLRFLNYEDCRILFQLIFIYVLFVILECGWILFCVFFFMSLNFLEKLSYSARHPFQNLLD